MSVCLQLIWWRSRSSASRIRDLIVPSGRPVSAAISRMRQIAEIGALDQRALFLGQLRQRLAQAAAFLLQFQHLGLIGFRLGAPGQIFGFGAARLAQRVDPAVAGDGEDPGRHAGPRRDRRDAPSATASPSRPARIPRPGHRSPRISSGTPSPAAQNAETARKGARVGVVAHRQSNAAQSGSESVVIFTSSPSRRLRTVRRAA